MKTRLEAALRFILPNLRDVIFIAVFVGVIGLGPRMLNVDGDLGRHLTIGKYILENRQIPTEDIFSHTMKGKPLTPHEWLAQVLFALSYSVGGLDGVVWFCALIIASTFTMIFMQSLARSKLVFIALFWTILAAAASSLHWLTRPHLFTLLMVVPWVAVLEEIRRGESTRWLLLPVLMLAWANLHGAFIAGFVILGAYLAGEIWQIFVEGAEPGRKTRMRYYLFGAGSAFLVTFINPAGWRLWETSLGFIRNQYLVGHTAEYLPPNFHEASTWPFLILIGLSIFVLGMNRAQIHPVKIFLLAGWGIMGLYSVRNVPIFALIAAPILAEASAQMVSSWKNGVSYSEFDRRIGAIEASLTGFVWPVVMVTGVAFAYAGGISLDFNGQGNRFDPQEFPVEAVDWLEAEPVQGNVFNYFPWGGYLLYRNWPQTLVFIDGQTDFYGEQLTRQYEQVLTLGDGWKGVLSDYHIDWVIMPSGSELIRSLSQDLSWETLYQDPTATVIGRLP